MTKDPRDVEFDKRRDERWRALNTLLATHGWELERVRVNIKQRNAEYCLQKLEDREKKFVCPIPIEILLGGVEFFADASIENEQDPAFLMLAMYLVSRVKKQNAPQ